MKPESRFSSKERVNGRYRKWVFSNDTKGKAHETDRNSVEKRSQNLKSRWDHVNRKTRSKRRRRSESWPDRVIKEHKVSEKIGTTDESHQVKGTKPTSSDRLSLEDGVRKHRKEKQNLAYQLEELEEGEIRPNPSQSPSPENHFNSTTSDNNDTGEINIETDRRTVLEKSKDIEEQPKTNNETTQLEKETERPVKTSNSLCFSNCNIPPKVPDCVSEVLLDKKELSTSTGGTAIVVESDSDSDIVELVGQKSVTSKNTQVKSYSHGLKDSASGATTMEKQNGHKDIADSIKSSENLQNLDGQSVPNEVANVSGSQEREAVTPACTISPESLAIPFNQPPVSTGIQCPPRHTSGPETVGFYTPSIINLQLPQLSNVHLSGNILRSFHESRTNDLDFGSMTTGLQSTNDLFQANLWRTQLARFDPLQIEMDRLKKHHEEELKMHQAMILHMKSKRDEDIEEVVKKYDILFQEAEASLQLKTMDFHTNYRKVNFNKLLANAVFMKHNDNEKDLTTETTRQAAYETINHLVQIPTQISMDRLDQHPPGIAPFVPVVNQPPQDRARPCSGGPMVRSNSMYHNGYESRKAAPHLRAPLTQSMRPSLHFPVPNNGECIQHLPRYSQNN